MPNAQSALKSIKKARFLILVCTLCLLCNVWGSQFASAHQLPLYLDAAGTILASVLCGHLPGMAVGVLTNAFASIFNHDSAYYGVVNVMIALEAAWFARKGYFRSFTGLLRSIGILTLTCGVFSALLTWCLYGLSLGDQASQPLAAYFTEAAGMPLFCAQVSADILIDMADKTIAVLAVMLVLRILPADFSDRFSSTLKAAPAENLAQWSKCRGTSLRTKTLLLLGSAALLIAVASVSISFAIYRENSINNRIQVSKMVAELVAYSVDPARVGEYLEQGREAEGYAAVEEQLYRIRDNSTDIEYIYVYQPRWFGFRVIFDLDTPDVPASEPGDLEPVREVFQDEETRLAYLPAMLQGLPVEPLITDDSYGWLLTAYAPIYDSEGRCLCYAAADIAMERLLVDEVGFLARVLSLFLGVFSLILVIGHWLVNHNVIWPVNAIAAAAGAFAFNSEEVRESSVEHLRNLSIHSGDEIENLYRAFTKTSEDTLAYIADIQNKSETISKMQNGLIMVLADMVESRDQNTGDHVRKTAAYVRILMNQMRKDGVYTDLLTPEFEEEVINAAPLHDIGKIKVPDAVLNKPGRLTDEEFFEMKHHTLAGEEIINRAIAQVPGSGYLDEARNLAEYHHERWDGKGYPHGIAGEAIPLSARIMAVADVFDALVSRRSYKEGFPFEKAADIIREGSGSHFDPKVVEAFFHAEPEIRRVAEDFNRRDDDENAPPQEQKADENAPPQEQNA